MRKGIIGLSLLLITSVIPAYSATPPKVGAACSKQGITKTFQGKKYICVSSKAKLVWSKGTSVVASASASASASAVQSKAPFPSSSTTLDTRPVCPIEIRCTVGSRGPGGGTVFYVSTEPNSWGQFLEVAPAGWQGRQPDPIAPWCKIFTADMFNVPQNPDKTYSPKIEGTIGRGKALSVFAASVCATGAASLAATYQGGGKTDWFLPSRPELLELYLAKEIIGGFTKDCYWSSSGGNGGFAWKVEFDSGTPLIVTKNYSCRVRPIRSF